MSEASPGATWQRAEIVGDFLDQRQTLLPLLDVQEDLVRRMFARHAHPLRRFIDLGSGDGAFSELVLGIAPDAHAVLVDFSEPMLEHAHVRFDGSPGSWQAVRGDLGDASWRASLPGGGYDAAVSSFAIHHLPSERKRALFAEVFELLEPGGLFVNMDCVTVEGPLAGLFDEQIAANAIHTERARGGSRSDEEVARDFLDDAEGDRPDSAEAQLQWLREAGFKDVELNFKWAEGAVFGAVKPPAGEGAG